LLPSENSKFYFCAVRFSVCAFVFINLLKNQTAAPKAGILKPYSTPFLTFAQIICVYLCIPFKTPSLFQTAACSFLNEPLGVNYQLLKSLKL